MINFSSLLLLISLTYLLPSYGQWLKLTIDPSLPNATIIDVGDIDNDGDTDIAANGSPYTKWYQFNNTDTTWVIDTIDNTLEGAVGIAIVDIDADSSLDIVTAGYISNDVRWYKNEGGLPVNWRRYFIDHYFNGAQFLCIGDLDSDGDPDVVVTGTSGNSVAWYENNMPDTNWSKHLIDDGGLFGAIVCDVGDLDSDGDIDVAATGFNVHNLVWYRNNHPDTNWTKAMIDGSLPEAFGVKIGDIDGDDTLDVVATSSLNDYVAWYKNTNVGQTWIKDYIYPDYFDDAGIVDIADMDLDGDNDVVATAGEANVVVWFENRLPDNWVRYNIDENLTSANDVCVADIFSDDTLDVLATGFHSNILNLYIRPPVSVELPSDIPPTDYELIQNYPNPFNPHTKIRYSIPQSSNVIIKVFDILGNEIEILVREEKPAGTYEITWNASGVPSGVYFYQLKAGDFIETKKMVLMK